MYQNYIAIWKKTYLLASNIALTTACILFVLKISLFSRGRSNIYFALNVYVPFTGALFLNFNHLQFVHLIKSNMLNIFYPGEIFIWLNIPNSKYSCSSTKSHLCHWSVDFLKFMNGFRMACLFRLTDWFITHREVHVDICNALLCSRTVFFS